MEKTINIEEILRYITSTPKYYEISEYSTDNDIINAIKEICRRVLELAAENADLDFSNWHSYGGCNLEKIIVDKQSILNTINQII